MALQPTDQPGDLDDVFDIIDENGGTGEWEEASTSETDTDTEIKRWLFPRFPGATDDADQYLTRVGLGPYDTDVETVAAWLSAPRNVVGAVLLLGEPGTGKTALVEAASTYMLDWDEDNDDPAEVESNLVTVVCTPDHTKDSLFLRFVGEGKGDLMANGEASPYTLGPIPYAAKHGKILYLDEVMLLMDGVKPLLYPLADGRRFLPEGNVDGSALEVHPDFRLILSSNPMVRGASLPEPIGSRCASTTLTVETDANMLRDLAIDESIVQAWETLGTLNLWRPQIREMRVADYWLSIDPAQSVSAFVPEHCPESQRKAVTEAAVACIGGGIREDGRLVVK